MKTSEIWRFGRSAQLRCDIRVVLTLDDLALRPENPLALASGCLLVQVGVPNEDFDPKRVLINGTFLVDSPRIAKKAGFERLGAMAISPEEVEFPVWLADDPPHNAFLCRGELSYRIAPEAAKKWDIRLSPATPEQLPSRIIRYTELLTQTAPPGGRVLGIPGSDIRYHPDRDACLAELGLKLDTTYIHEIESRSTERAEHYAHAILPTSKSRKK